MRLLIASLQQLISRWAHLTRQQLALLSLAGFLLLLVLLGEGNHQPNTALIQTRLNQAQPVETWKANIQESEIRGVWITNVASSVLFAPWGISRAVHELADMHFNTLYPVVWNRGKSFYHSDTLKQLTGHAIAPLMTLTHPTADPLETMLKEGHKNNLRVIPWFEYGFMVPLHSRLAQQHPNWLTTRQNGSPYLHESSFTEGADNENADNESADNESADNESTESAEQTNGLLKEGHKNNLRVIPWFEYGFMVPLHSRLAQQHPNWLTTRQNGSPYLHESSFTEGADNENADNESADNESADNESTESAEQTNGLLSRLLNSGAPSELGWLNPLHPEVQSLILSLVGEVVGEYSVDGIQFDDHFALPAAFGYDDYTVALYREEHEGQFPPTNTDDAEWTRWRADKLSQFVGVLHERVKATCPTCIISLSP
ncbi:MAG: family 10 glycosylhydrolase, partial [Cyanobacteria bacterium J06576_12]